MKAYNRRIEPFTLLGMPKTACIGLLILAGSVMGMLVFPVWILKFFFLLPAGGGLIVAMIAFRRKGTEHLMDTITTGRMDQKTRDLGIME